MIEETELDIGQPAGLVLANVTSKLRDVDETTRGKRLVLLVGQKKAIAIAVRNASGRQRGSKLDEWLRLGASRASFDRSAVFSASVPAALRFPMKTCRSTIPAARSCCPRRRAKSCRNWRSTST